MNAGNTNSRHAGKGGDGMESEEPSMGLGATPGSSPHAWHQGTNMEFQEFHFDGDDLPEALQQIIASITRNRFETGLAHDTAEDEVMPSKEQLEIVPGDLVAVTHTADGGKMDNEFTIARVVNPEDHAEEFPDWENRLLKSFLLTLWYTPGSPNGKLGWMPRAKLVKFPKERWDQMLGWIQEDDPEGTPPAWLIRRYNEALIGLAEANPERLALPVTCGDCGSAAVLVRLETTDSASYCVGTDPEEKGKTAQEAEKLYVVSPYTKTRKVECWSECLDCHKTHEISSEVPLMG